MKDEAEIERLRLALEEYGKGKKEEEEEMTSEKTKRWIERTDEVENEEERVGVKDK